MRGSGRRLARHGAAMVEVKRPYGGMHHGGENICSSNGDKHTDVSLEIDDGI
jgi:hypothetical protein